jgi:hypothetical protein
MNAKNVIIVLFVIALLTLCVPNVAAAPVSKLTTNNYDNQRSDIPTNPGRPTFILFCVTDFAGRPISSTPTINVGDKLEIPGVLTYDKIAGNCMDLGRGIGQCTVTIQEQSNDGTWQNVATTMTFTGSAAGLFTATFEPHATGVYNFRAVFDGGAGTIGKTSVYFEPSVSNSQLVNVVNNVIT